MSEDTPVFDLLGEDGPTVATARFPFEETVGGDQDEDELLELETRELVVPEHDVEPETDETLTDPALDIEPDIEPVPESKDEVEMEINASIELDESVQETIASDTFSMFGDSGEPDVDDARPGLLGRVASAIGLLLVGGAIGMGVYYFAFVPKPVSTYSPQFSEMKAANIPLSAFEENRRSVDIDPAGYVSKFATSPQDCEDFYLLGRAYLLSGDYIKARAAFTEARNRLSEADPVNAKILASDIAVSLAVTNDTTIQSILKKELDAAKPAMAANTSSNSNANLKTTANVNAN